MDLIVKHQRQRIHEQNRFTAAMQGVDLDKGSEANEAVERVRRRAASKLAGGDLAVEQREFADLGFGYDKA